MLDGGWRSRSRQAAHHLRLLSHNHRVSSCAASPLSSGGGAGSHSSLLLFSKIWRGSGQHDGLNEHHIANFLTGKLRAPSNNPKRPKGGPLRWRTRSAVLGVARLILHHGEQLDEALANNWPREELPTLPEVVGAQTKRIAQLESQLAAANLEALRVRDAHRKAADRLEETREDLKQKKAEAVSKLRTELAEKHAAALIELKQQAASELEALLRTKLIVAHKVELDSLEGEFDSALEWKQKRVEAAEVRLAEVEAASAKKAQELAAAAILKEKLATVKARKRTRNAEAEATADATDKRVESLSTEVTSLKRKVEELQQRAPTGTATAGPTTPQTSWVRKRQRTVGRFDVAPWIQRPLIWAQLGRRVPPSTINANITEVIRAYAPDTQCSYRP